jgi:hypothetical protein
MNKKVIIIGLAVVAAAIGVFLVMSFMNSDSNKASQILEDYFNAQTDVEVPLSIDDFENTGLVTDEASLEGFGVELSDTVVLDKLYIFVAKADPDTNTQYLVDVANETVYEKIYQQSLGDTPTTVAFYSSLIPGYKTVVVTVEAENPQNFKVSYGGVELTYNAQFNAFTGDISATTAEDLKPE